MIERNTLTVEEFILITEKIGLKVPSNRLIHASLENSITVKYIEDNKTVGMARLITDKGYMSLLTDVAVLKEYRNKGIGNKLVNNLIDYIKETKESNEEVMIELLSVPGKSNFYEQLGFKSNPVVIEKGMYKWIK